MLFLKVEINLAIIKFAKAIKLMVNVK